MCQSPPVCLRVCLSMNGRSHGKWNVTVQKSKAPETSSETLQKSFPLPGMKIHHVGNEKRGRCAKGKKARCVSLYCSLPFAQIGSSSQCEWGWVIDPRVPCQCMPVSVTSASYFSCHSCGLVHHSVPRDILVASQPNSLSVQSFPCIQMSYPKQIHLTNGADFLNKSQNVYL